MKNRIKIYIAGLIFILIIATGITIFISHDIKLSLEGRGWIVFLILLINVPLIISIITMSTKNADELGDIFTCSWNKIQDKECKEENNND